MKLLVTGGSGMLGKALQEEAPDNISATFLSSFDCDLRDRNKTLDLFKNGQFDSVIHLAAKVGGVKANTDYVSDFYHDNILINTNVLEAARIYDVKKVVSLLSTCVYPDKVSYPLTEDQIHNGEPHFSNFGYAYAKRMLEVQSRACRKQYGCNFITAIPNNLYGKWDNFEDQNSHVVPAIIKKIYNAKIKNTDITLWGDGRPIREFTYSNDIAKILFFLLKNYNETEPINIGNPKAYSIADVANIIKNIMNFKGNIIWNTKMPSGQFKKPSDNSRLIKMGWNNSEYSDLESSMKIVCDWFQDTYPNIRGV